MAHIYARVRLHLVWATRLRRPWLDPAWRSRLFAVCANAVARRGGTVHAAGGTRDHIHLYVGLPVGVSVAELVDAVKTSSATWIHDTVPSCRGFAWQRGYGAFSVNPGDDGGLREYVRNQEHHHRDRSFLTELAAMLTRAGIPHDPHALID